MSEYMVKVSFWLRAFDSVTIETSDESQLTDLAKAAAITVIRSHAQPEATDFDERREGSIAYIDRVDPAGREEVVGFVPFDDDHLHGPLHEFIERIAALPTDGEVSHLSKEELVRWRSALVEEAKTLVRHVA
jgi:hypothetical protein